MNHKKDRDDLFIEGIKNIARENLEDNTRLLMKWWANKYNLPLNHPLLLEQHEEELMLEYFEDNLFEEKLKEAKDQEEKEDWASELSEEHDEKIQQTLKKRNAPSVLDKWRARAEIAENIEDEEEIDEVF